MGTIALLILIAVMVPIPYSIARHGWAPAWQESMASAIFLVGVVFIAWYAVFLIVGGSGNLIPLAMAAFLIAYLAGLLARARSRRPPGTAGQADGDRR